MKKVTPLNQLRRNHLQSKLQAKTVWMTPLNFATPTYGEAGYLSRKISMRLKNGINKMLPTKIVESVPYACLSVQI